MKEYRTFILSSYKDIINVYGHTVSKEERIEKLAKDLNIKSKNFRTNSLMYISVEYGTNQYEDLEREAEKWGFHIHELTYFIECTKKEVDMADYFVLNLGIYGKEDYTEGYQTEYIDLYCNECGNHYLIPKGECYIKKTEFRGKDIATSMLGNVEILVSDVVKNLIQSNNLSGVEFFKAHHYNNKIKNDFNVWRMAVVNTLPPIESGMTVVYEDGYCSTCKKHHVHPLSYVRYKKEVIHNALDFNLSCEFFGSGWYGSPKLIVSKKVYDMIRDNKINGCKFEIVGSV